MVRSLVVCELSRLVPRALRRLANAYCTPIRLPLSAYWTPRGDRRAMGVRTALRPRRPPCLCPQPVPCPIAGLPSFVEVVDDFGGNNRLIHTIYFYYFVIPFINLILVG